MSRKIGDKGEDTAAAYIEAQGGRILKRNHYIRGGEVDIIFADGSTTVFCEVKARKSDRFGTPAEYVDVRKQQRICRAALDFTLKNKTVDENYRFDIIEIQGGRLNHIKNAFEFIEPQP